MDARLPDAVRRRPLDPDDGSSWLAGVVGDARVVAIGENNHHIAEFGALRAAAVRYLVGELGFRVVAMESGFAEGERVDAWIRGAPGELDDVARDGFTFRMGDSAEVGRMLTWLRESGGGVRFAGLDVPGSGGSPRLALERVRAHLARHAPGDVALADVALAATDAYAAANNGVAPGRYAALDDGARDAATTALARLLLRVEARAPGVDPAEHRVARHHALGALRLDEQLREFGALFSPDPPARTISSRDTYQAQTVRLLRELLGRDERIAILLHNGHAARVPFAFLPGVEAPSVGTYLADELGADYVVVGVTAQAGATTTLALDPDARHGIALGSAPLDDPAPDSVERAIGPLDAPALFDLRPARDAHGPTSIRHATIHTSVDVLAAFDALVCLPTMHPSAFVG